MAEMQLLTIGDARVWVKTEEGEWSRVDATGVVIQPEGVVSMTADGVKMHVPLWAVLSIAAPVPASSESEKRP